MYPPSPDFLLPRNETEMCELFEDFLRGAFEQDTIHLTDADLIKLNRLGILPRAFRRWYQTTWGSRNWSRHFQGETPRQELAFLHDGLNNGSIFLSIRLVKENQQYHIKPLLINNLDRNQLFETSRQSVKPTEAMAEPRRDPEFSKFVTWIKECEELARVHHRFNPADPFQSWKLFWSQAGANLVLQLGLKRPRAELLAATGQVQAFLDDALCQQGNGPDDFFEMDTIYVGIWDILRQYDPRLPPYHVLEQKVEGKHSISEYAMKTSYFLGRLFDETIFFPADRYFGALEAVWTDQMNFMNDFMAMIAYLAGELELRPRFKKDPKLKQLMDPLHLWYSPCTAFRILDPFREALLQTTASK